MNAPTGLDRLEVSAQSFDSEAGVVDFACDNGYDYAAWIGSLGEDSLRAVLYKLGPEKEQLVDLREASPAYETMVAARLESLSARLLMAVFQKGERWPGLEYLQQAPPETIRNFIQGEALFRDSNFRPAIAFFEYVVEDDSTWAYGHYRLATAQAWDTYTGQEAITRAVALSGSLGPSDSILVHAVHEHYYLRHGFLEAFRGIDSLDAEHLLQLGDAIFHLAHMRRLDPEEAGCHLTAALKRDPDLTPARLHLIDLAILRRDSAAAYQEFEAYGRRASGSIPYLRAKYALELVFGSPDTRTRAVAAIDSSRARLPFSVPYLAAQYLGSADLLPLQEQLLRLDERVLVRNPDEDPSDRILRGSRRLLAYNYVYQGKLEEAERVLGLLGPEDQVFKKLVYYSTAMWGLPWPTDRDREFSSAALDRENRADLFYTASRYLESGREIQYRVVDRFLAELAEDDRLVDLWRTALEGRRLWYSGQREQGLALVHSAATHPEAAEFYGIHETMRWWLGRMNLALGRNAESESWFRSIPDNPYALCYAREAGRRVAQEPEGGFVPDIPCRLLNDWSGPEQPAQR